MKRKKRKEIEKEKKEKNVRRGKERVEKR